MPFPTQGFRAVGTLLKRAGVTVAEIRTIDIGGAKSDFADATNMDSLGSFKEWVPTLLEAGEVSFTGNFLGTTDATQTQLLADFNGQTLLAWTIVLPFTRGTFTFSGYVASFDVKMDVTKLADFTAKIKISGPNALA
jgi:hypothetical protein